MRRTHESAVFVYVGFDRPVVPKLATFVEEFVRALETSGVGVLLPGGIPSNKIGAAKISDGYDSRLMRRARLCVFVLHQEDHRTDFSFQFAIAVSQKMPVRAILIRTSVVDPGPIAECARTLGVPVTERCGSGAAFAEEVLQAVAFTPPVLRRKRHPA